MSHGSTIPLTTTCLLMAGPAGTPEAAGADVTDLRGRATVSYHRADGADLARQSEDLEARRVMLHSFGMAASH